MARASCKYEGGCNESTKRMVEIDRLSNLPDQVSHHILSFLAMDHLARFCCVSKRCRELSLSSPALDFDEFTTVHDSSCSKRHRLLNGLDRFLFRRGNNKIQWFRVHWLSHDEYDSEETPCCCKDEYFRIMSWVHNAVRCNVEVLDLDFNDNEEWTPKFPSSIFLCGSLRSLTVDISCMVIKAPSFSFSSNLRYLEFKYGTVDKGFFKWISCCCKCIEDLVLQEVEAENITIESSSLERFSFDGGDSTELLNISGEKLEEITIDWIVHSPINKSLTIVAPNLKSLSWKGNLMNHRNLGKLESLQGAVIHLEPKVDIFGSVFEVLSRLSMVEDLFLNEATIKALFREGAMPAPLENVHYLGLKIGSFNDELVPAMVSLFRGMPNLCTLYIKTKPPLNDPESNTSGFDMEYWKMQNLDFYQLKKLTIEFYNYDLNGVVLAKYIFEHAQNLEEFAIYSYQS